MILYPAPALLDNLYWITLVAVIVSSASAVLIAGVKQFDLFGVIIIAITTGLGGGSLRDILLAQPVFWIEDQSFFVVSLCSAIIVFLAARKMTIPQRVFLIPDAAGLATFGVAGTLVSLMAGAPWLVSSFMGVMTGVMGGIFRDILSNEPPVVFSSPLYATVSWAGSLLLIGLLWIKVDITLAALIAGGAIFGARILAMQYDLRLPMFRFKQ